VGWLACIPLPMRTARPGAASRSAALAQRLVRAAAPLPITTCYIKDGHAAIMSRPASRVYHCDCRRAVPAMRAVAPSTSVAAVLECAQLGVAGETADAAR